MRLTRFIFSFLFLLTIEPMAEADVVGEFNKQMDKLGVGAEIAITGSGVFAARATAACSAQHYGRCARNAGYSMVLANTALDLYDQRRETHHIGQHYIDDPDICAYQVGVECGGDTSTGGTATATGTATGGTATAGDTSTGSDGGAGPTNVQPSLGPGNTPNSDGSTGTGGGGGEPPNPSIPNDRQSLLAYFKGQGIDLDKNTMTIGGKTITPMSDTEMERFFKTPAGKKEKANMKKEMVKIEKKILAKHKLKNSAVPKFKFEDFSFDSEPIPDYAPKQAALDTTSLEERVAGMSVNIGKDRIGVKQDNIFNMINRRYQSKRKRNLFIEL